MNVFDFLIYCFNHYPIVSAVVVIMLTGGISNAISHLFYTKYEAEAQKEHEKQFWKS